MFYKLVFNWSFGIDMESTMKRFYKDFWIIQTKWVTKTIMILCLWQLDMLIVFGNHTNLLLQTRMQILYLDKTNKATFIDLIKRLDLAIARRLQSMATLSLSVWM